MQVFPNHIRSVVRRRVAALALSAAVLLSLVVPAHAQAASGEAAWAAEGDNDVIDITFPNPEGSGYHYTNTYDACRSGCSRTHRATDIMADKMVTVHAVADGEICFAPGIDEPMPHYGYMIRLCGDDGLRYDYVHLNNDTPGTDDGAGGQENAYAPGIEDGVRVERGQLLGWVGDSGNAEHTGSHTHFEIHDGHDSDVRLNPFASLQAAEQRGDFPGSITPLGAGDEGAGDEEPSTGVPEPLTGPATPQTDDVAPDRPTSDVPATTGESPQAGAPGRLAGATRIETAVALSQETRVPGRARAVVIVPATSHVEALVAAPLAARLDAPVLLSGPDALSPAVIEEVRRLGPRNAYLIGTVSQLSAGVHQGLTAAGVANIARIEAADRYRLSVALAEELVSYAPEEAVSEVILALGDAEEASRAWPDALSASALAAHTGTPILLTQGTRLPDAVADLLTDLRPDHVTVVGGTAAISAEVADDAAAVAGSSPRRLAGATRYATSVAVAQAGIAAGLDADEVWIATGRNYPDALAAGPAAAASGSPLVLVDGEVLGGSPASQVWLARFADRVVVIGGESAVASQVAQELAR